MFELNLINIVFIPLTLLLLSFVYSRLQKLQEYRSISTHIPSITKTIWDEIKVSISMAMLQPKDTLPFFMETVRKNGPIVHLNIAGRSFVVLTDPEDLKIIMSSTQHLTKGSEYNMLKPWLNEGLLLSSGSKWQSRRKILTNAFHLKTLEMYNPLINKHSKVLVKKLLEAFADNNEGICIKEYITLCSLDIICVTIMGVEIDAQHGKSVQYSHSIKIACKSMIERFAKFWLWNDLVYRLSTRGRLFYNSLKVLHDFTDNVIKNKRASFKSLENQDENSLPDRLNNIRNHCLEKDHTKNFLDLLLKISEEHPDQMTDKDIREEVDTFLFAGHDTSSISMTLTLILLGIHQDIQDRVREELYTIFGDSDRDATIEDLKAMEYLDAVIKESLRLYPSVPSILRKIHTTLQLKNYSIPPMTTLFIIPYIVHRNKEIYPNPEEFNPERFLSKNIQSNSFAYLPFSAGLRNCIGQKFAMYQMKTVISTIIRKTKIKTLGTMDDIQISAQVVLTPESLPKIKLFAI